MAVNARISVVRAGGESVTAEELPGERVGVSWFGESLTASATGRTSEVVLMRGRESAYNCFFANSPSVRTAVSIVSVHGTPQFILRQFL
jgi:hypothetical protein